MHLTVKKEATRPPSINSLQQQAKFDDFTREFNGERPHEALGMKCPAEIVGIATLVTHPALDAVQDGLKQGLARRGYVEGNTINYLVRNGAGQIQLAATIARELAVHRPAVTVAITTPMAQSVTKAPAGPIVFAAVTDPVGAGLVESLDQGETDTTGASDAWPSPSSESSTAARSELTTCARVSGSTRVLA
jgi:ABC-type uncharacterized transport system substrate-binding protein